MTRGLLRMQTQSVRCIRMLWRRAQRSKAAFYSSRYLLWRKIQKIGVKPAERLEIAGVLSPFPFTEHCTFRSCIGKAPRKADSVGYFPRSRKKDKDEEVAVPL